MSFSRIFMHYYLGGSCRFPINFLAVIFLCFDWVYRRIRTCLITNFAKWGGKGNGDSSHFCRRNTGCANVFADDVLSFIFYLVA